jgi:hypothetical protein
MRLRLPLLAAIIATAVGAATAGATTAPRLHVAHAHLVADRPTALKVAHLGRADLRSAASVRAAQRRILRDRLARGAVGAAPGTVYVGLFNELAGIDDVNHDGVGDLMQLGSTGTPDLIVRSGRDGRTLWHQQDPNLLLAFYVRLPGGTGRILELTGDATETDFPVAGVVDATMTVRARDAANGEPKWAVPFEGYVEYDLVNEFAVQFPEFDGVLGRAHATPLLQLDRVTAQLGIAENAFSMQPFTIDVSDGSTVTNGQPVATDGFAYVVPVGDVDSDGIDDTVTATWGDLPRATLVSGATGQTLWSTTPAPGDFGVTFAASSPDINGDHRTDLLVGFVADTARVTALNGVDGAVIWTTAGDTADPIGDVDGDHRQDVRTFAFDPSGQRYSVVTADGHLRWTRSVATNDEIEGFSFGVSDVDGDHVGDLYLRLINDQQLERQSAGIESILIRGRTGATRVTGDLGWPMTSPSGSVRFVLPVRTRNGMTITGYDGRTASRQWVTALSDRGAQRMAAWTTIAAGHRTWVVELVQGVQKNVLLAQDWSTGQVHWQSSYASGPVIVIK